MENSNTAKVQSDSKNNGKKKPPIIPPNQSKIAFTASATPNSPLPKPPFGP